MGKNNAAKKVVSVVQKVRTARRSRRGVKVRSGYGKAWDASLPKALRSKVQLSRLHQEAERESLAAARKRGLTDVAANDLLH